MKLRIESAGNTLSPSLKKFASEKLGSLDKYYKDIQEIEVILSYEVKGGKDTVNCVLNIRVPGKDINIKSKSNIFEDAILKAADSAKSKLRTRKTQDIKAQRAKSPNRKVAAKKAL
ncbi:MAG: HPF/RaiA family ribosome-associated protein [Bacteroidia bacterium]|nr:HPF/RaiA family ribosome-associated protein [Bacteroidia bacterium]MCZ2249071.1 HPF/RaiA family ribosome-associated protein [Bacteroidia bacterium]